MLVRVTSGYFYARLTSARLPIQPEFSFSIEEWRMAMSVSYDKLWKLLIDKKMNRTELKDAAGISFNVLAKLGRNEFVSMESLQKICQTLSCNIGEIMDFIEEDTVEH